MIPDDPPRQPTLFHFVAVGAVIALVSFVALVLLGSSAGFALLGGALIFAALQLVYLALIVRAARTGIGSDVPGARRSPRGAPAETSMRRGRT